MRAQGIDLESAVNLAKAQKAETAAEKEAMKALEKLKGAETRYLDRAANILDKATAAPSAEVQKMRASLASARVDVGNTIRDMSQSARRVAVGGGSPAIPPPDGPNGAPPSTTNWRPRSGIGFALATTFFNMLNADSPSGVLNAAMEGGLDFMGGAVGGAVCGPPGAVVGSQTSRIVKDPKGSVKAIVHCVFGGDCGDAPFVMWGAFQTAGNAVVGCVFGGDCGQTAGAILGPAVPIDVGRARMQAQRR